MTITTQDVQTITALLRCCEETKKFADYCQETADMLAAEREAIENGTSRLLSDPEAAEAITRLTEGEVDIETAADVAAIVRRCTAS